MDGWRSVHFLLLFSLSFAASITPPIGQTLRFHGYTPVGRVLRLCVGGRKSGGAYAAYVVICDMNLYVQLCALCICVVAVIVEEMDSRRDAEMQDW